VFACSFCVLPAPSRASRSEFTRKNKPTRRLRIRLRRQRAIRKLIPGPNNEAYAAKVKEYTTESYFMTELVDHLPLSDKVPSPDKITGYEAGAPGHLTYSKDLYRYYRELEKTSPRVKVFTAPEKSEEGKEQLLIAVGDEATLGKTEPLQRHHGQARRPTQSQRRRRRKFDRRRERHFIGHPARSIRPKLVHARC
jgi:hypothetical protein